MSLEKDIENIFDSIRKIAFYVGHGKYNDHMSLEEVQAIKATLEKILDIEKEYEKAKTLEEKESIYNKLELFTTFSIRDFIGYEFKEDRV